MPKSTRNTPIVALVALQRLVADHGDSFHFSISKRGRVWLTLTHYEGERYATSTELGGLADTTDLLRALAVCTAGHRAKCFGDGAHTDTWLGEQATRDVADDAEEALNAWLATLSDTGPHVTLLNTAPGQERDDRIDK